jgi:membrane protease YdiL (CAAX protease family)
VPAARWSTAAGRAALATPVLAVVWAAAFHLTDLPFFPLIAAGGVVTGLAGIWVRRGAGPQGAGSPRTVGAAACGGLPRLALSGRHALLAVGAALAHLALAHALFRIGAALAPGLAPTAEEVYGRTGAVDLRWAVLFGGVVTAPLEEVFWRGAVHPLVAGLVRARLPRLSSAPGATVATGAALYGLFHLTTGHFSLVAAALLGGVVWGWLQERTGAVGAPMLAHGVWACGMLLAPVV